MATEKLYAELASWWPLLSPVADYEEEASSYYALLRDNSDGTTTSLLELGCGGGNNAFFMKRHFTDVALVDRAPAMLALSRQLNPDCAHAEGDMRSVRLGRQFDCVFVHDAVCYMTTHADLKNAVETAFLHCRPGGVALFCPDFLRENFDSSTDDGGEDGHGRSMRYLEWTWDPDPTDSTYTVDYAYMLRDVDGSVTVEHDRHIEGLFGRDEWLGILSHAGFNASCVPIEHSQLDPGRYQVFVARRPKR